MAFSVAFKASLAISVLFGLKPSWRPLIVAQCFEEIWILTYSEMRFKFLEHINETNE